MKVQRGQQGKEYRKTSPLSRRSERIRVRKGIEKMSKVKEILLL